ncbi:hypothetical protein BC829DRAFT_453776, partial [Chytridium lagenaria]
SLVSPLQNNPLCPHPSPPTSNVGLETIRLLESDDGARLLVLCTILVRNLAYEKHVDAVYTLDNWTSQHPSPSAVYKQSMEGMDRFTLEFEITTPPPVLRLEFAVRCRMGGCEYWDNRGGWNHFLEAVEVTPKKMKRATLVLDGEALRAYAAAGAAAAAYAARLGEAVAAEVVGMGMVERRVEGGVGGGWGEFLGDGMRVNTATTVSMS